MNKPNFTDPEYVQGQIDALHALIFALAHNMSPDEFRFHAMERLQVARDAVMNQPVSEARLAAIDATTDWVDHLTK